MKTLTPEIKRVIEILDQRISSLQTIRKMLEDEFGIDLPASVNSKVSLPDQSAPLFESDGSMKKKTRKEILIEFLKKNGPSTRKQIHLQTGIPLGTIAYLLNQKDLFRHDQHRKWTLNR